MKVNFLIIGAQKGGSTWLYDNLRQHPSVAAPTHEIHFFSSDENYPKGSGWYHGNFAGGHGKLLGEKTPEYLTVVPTQNKKTSAETHQRIFLYNPEVKMIVVLREPINRLVSAVNHMYRTARIPCYVTMKDLLMGAYREQAEAFSLLQNGLYYQNLKKYLEIFSADQIKVLFFETDVVVKPLETLRNICSFLDIGFDESYFPSATQKKNEYQMSKPALMLNHYFPGLRFFNNRLNHIFPPFKARLDEDTKSFLQDYYKSENLKLKELTGYIPGNWIY